VIIPIGRRITARDGTDQGAVVASFVPGESRRFFQSLNVGNGGIVRTFTVRLPAPLRRLV
jgi:hypothetical protein